jgi:hypothetical protein
MQIELKRQLKYFFCLNVDCFIAVDVCDTRLMSVEKYLRVLATAKARLYD